MSACVVSLENGAHAGGASRAPLADEHARTATSPSGSMQHTHAWPRRLVTQALVGWASDASTPLRDQHTHPHADAETHRYSATSLSSHLTNPSTKCALAGMEGGSEKRASGSARGART